MQEGSTGGRWEDQEGLRTWNMAAQRPLPPGGGHLQIPLGALSWVEKPFWQQMVCRSFLMAHLSSRPRKLFPTMTILDRASTDQLLHSKLLYSAVPQCGM